MDNIPEKFLSSDGTLNTDALIKSYNELEKKMGTMISVPNENSDENTRRKFNRAIGVPENASEYPTHELYDDENLRNKFFEIGLTKTQVEKIYDIANEFLAPVISDLYSVQNETSAINELKNMNYNKMILGCLSENPSNEFYKHMGGKLVDSNPLILPNGQKLKENLYYYDI